MQVTQSETLRGDGYGQEDLQSGPTSSSNRTRFSADLLSCRPPSPLKVFANFPLPNPAPQIGGLSGRKFIGQIRIFHADF